MNRFAHILARYKYAVGVLTEPESAVFLGRAVWASALAGVVVVCVAAVGWGAFELVKTFDVIDQEGGSSRVTTPSLDRTLLRQISQQLISAQERYDEAAQVPVTATDPSR